MAKKKAKRKSAPRRKATKKRTHKNEVTLIEKSAKGRHEHRYRSEAIAKRAVKFMRKNNLIPATYTITKEL